jgi:hypothetical protein
MKRWMVAWKAVEYKGTEHMALREDENGFMVESVMVVLNDVSAFRLDYEINCDTGYAVREVKLNLVEELSTIHMTSDGRGKWFDNTGKPLPELEGCIDIDITVTPFTNTLPIKRINWTVGQSETLKMVYFLIPEMTFYADEQRYTCLEQRADGATFRFEQLATGFTAVLPVDADGLVLDYPGLFERVQNKR